MRDFFESMLSFTWAMSLFGAERLAGALMPRDSGGQQSRSTSESLRCLTRATSDQLGGAMRAAFVAGDNLQRGVMDVVLGLLPLESRDPGRESASNIRSRRLSSSSELGSDEREEAIIRQTEGTGRFSEDGKIVLTTVMYKQNGEEDGRHVVSFDVGYVLEPQMANVWYQWFDLPRDNYYDPFKPDHKTSPMSVRAETESRWTLDDGSTIRSAGPAFFNLARFIDGSCIFFITVAAGIKGGTGRYSDVEGTQVSLGSAYIEKGEAFGPGSVFKVKTIEAFRIIRRADIEAPSSSWPYQSKSIKVNDRRGRSFDMSYVDVGSGDPILFLHGNPNWSYTWRNIIPYMSPLGRCVAPDLIGMSPFVTPKETSFSYSDHVQFVTDFIEKLRLTNITLVAHDWGTALAFDYASRHEENVRGLAFMEAAYKSYPRWETFSETDSPQSVRDNFRTLRAGFPDKRSPGYKLIVEQNIFLDVLTPTITGRAITQAEAERNHAPFKDARHREVIWRWVNQIPIEGRPEETRKAFDSYHDWLVRTNLPKLLFYVNPGMIVTAESVRWLSQNLKNLTTVNVGPGVHYPQETNPHLVGTELARWYRSLPLRASAG